MHVTYIRPIIARHYHFHVYHASARNGGYVVETNCGPKFVSVWKNQEEVEWAFSWREELVRYGHRTLDRFIRTREATPYVCWQGQYIVVQDFGGNQPVRFAQQKDWEVLGHFVGDMYRVFVRESAAANYHFLRAKMEKEYPLVSMPLQTLKKQMLAENNFFTSMVGAHWESLTFRLRQAKNLWQSSLENEPIKLALPNLTFANWYRTDFECIGFQSKEQSIGTSFEALASFLQRLYMQEMLSEEAVEYFYRGFEQAYRPSLAAEYQILALLVAPLPFFEILQKYRNHQLSSHECIERWLELCVRQEKIDELQQWLAKRIDRKRQESVSV